LIIRQCQASISPTTLYLFNVQPTTRQTTHKHLTCSCYGAHLYLTGWTQRICVTEVTF